MIGKFPPSAILHLGKAMAEGAKPPVPTTGSGVRRGGIAEAYPDDNPKTIHGVKKPSVSAIPPSAILHLGQAMAEGERKYGLLNWRDKNVSASVYYNAAFRHLLEWWDGANRDEDSKCHPLAHVMACCAIILDAELQGKLNDDRGRPGRLHHLISLLTKG